ncbi:MAG: hypothetical protein JW774_07930 [Candidatus Aureabacteria bacterium]|nr:hypothetical protein [Candidatus Auribacterota bacterium]
MKNLPEKKEIPRPVSTSIDIKNRIEEMQKKYRLEYKGSIGKFTAPVHIAPGNNSIWVVNHEEKGSSLVEVHKETGEIKNQFHFDELLHYIQWIPENESILFCHWANVGLLYRFDLKTNKISLLNLDQEKHGHVSSIKIINDKIVSPDTYTHQLFFYDLNGNLERVINLKTKFEFPIQLCRILSTTQILLTAYDESYRTRYPDLFNKYRITDMNPKTNLAILDLKNESIHYLPKLETPPGEYIWSISQHIDGSFFLNSPSTLFKLDSNLNIIFSINLEKNIERINQNQFRCYGSFIENNRLFLLEIYKNRTIYQFSI